MACGNLVASENLSHRMESAPDAWTAADSVWLAPLQWFSEGVRLCSQSCRQVRLRVRQFELGDRIENNCLKEEKLLQPK